MNRISAYTVMGLAAFSGGGSLLLFGAFLILAPLGVMRLNLPEAQAVIWDGALCALFFVQHSMMIRQSFRRRLSAFVPSCCHAAVYAIASGAALTAVVLLWQTSPTTVFALRGWLHWLPRVFSALALGVFVWGVRALRVFDPFGRRALWAHLRGQPLPQLPLAVRGPYVWVRHPLYSCMMVLIWSVPEAGLDRLLFDVLWTAWIVFGTRLEERDLVAEFGDHYHRYQRIVPMLIPWRGPAGRRLQAS
ncbi:MAG TPA: NnrU family protein [Opitutaceae bacterium]|nr:NnrU family protein [Opitutaceae bacterium]